MSSGKFTLAYIFLNEDCSEVRPQSQGVRENLDEATVRDCLEAFAAIPATNLTEVNAKIRVRYDQQHLMISRSGKFLYSTPIPELSNTPERSTPDGILTDLTGTELMEAPDPTENAPAQELRKPRLSLGLPIGVQIAVLAISLTILAGMFYQSITVSPPTGYVLIEDSSRINTLQEQFDGTYGSPDTRMNFQISHGRVSFFGEPAKGEPQQLLKEESFRYALRGGHTVALLGAKGDILEFQPRWQPAFRGQELSSNRQIVLPRIPLRQALFTTMTDARSGGASTQNPLGKPVSTQGKLLVKSGNSVYHH